MATGELPRRNLLTIVKLQRRFDDVGADGDLARLTGDLAAGHGLTANIQPSHPLGPTTASSNDRNAQPDPDDQGGANCESGAKHHQSLPHRSARHPDQPCRTAPRSRRSGTPR